MATRSLHVVAALGSLALLGVSRAARAACTVDSVDTRVVERAGVRTDQIRFFVGSGTPDCGWIRLSQPGAGVVTDASARVLRGDTRNAAFGAEHLVRSSDGAALVTHFSVPGLRVGDIVVVDVERRIGQNHRWTPDAWGPAGWAALRVRGSTEPSASNVPTDTKGWYVERAQVEAAGPGLAVQFGTPPERLPAAHHTGRARLHIELRPEASPPPGEPPLGSTRRTWQVPVGPSGSHAIAWPADATDTVCRVEGSAAALVLPDDRGCRVLEAEPGAVLVAAWTTPRLQLAGEAGPSRRFDTPDRLGRSLAEHGPLPSTGTLAGIGPIAVELSGPGVSFRGQVRDGDRQSSVAGDGALRFEVPGTDAADPSGIPPHGGWWVTAVHGQPLLSDRAALVGAIARTALAASVPEPGLPARLRGRLRDPGAIPEVQALVRQQVRVGRAPDQRSLQPRKLLAARRSTHASEWEAALLTARYLRQLRLDAVPIPVRLPHVAAADPGMPAGFDHAVVRVRLEADGDTAAQTLWLDPACAVCAPGELRPTLWGGDALDATSSRLPDAPEGSAVERIVSGRDGMEAVSIERTGTAALALRLELLQLPADARIAAIEARYGGVLERHEGLGERGAPIRLELSRPGGLDPLGPETRVPTPSAAHVRVPWTGERVRELRVPADHGEVVWAPAATAEVRGTQVSFTRTLGVENDGTRVAHEVFLLGDPVVARGTLEALRERLVPVASELAPPVRLEAPDPADLRTPTP